MRCHAPEYFPQAPEESDLHANGSSSEPSGMTVSEGFALEGNSSFLTAGAEKLIPPSPAPPRPLRPAAERGGLSGRGGEFGIVHKEVVTLHIRYQTPKEEIHEKLVGKIERGLRLRGRDHPAWLKFDSFKKCGQASSCVLWCMNCDEEHPLKWSCSKKWCPLCNWRITEARRKRLETFASLIRNPQHLVMTQRNFERISHQKFKELNQNLAKLRRHKLWSLVNGGCTSVELTNKGEGWHLHTHSLLDVVWIDAAKLAVEWGHLVGQEFGIVYRSNITDINYEKEICKYVVKPADLLKWKTKDLLDFIESIHRTRFFFQFGTMAKIKPMKDEKISRCPSCEAEGCIEFLPDKDMRMEQKLKFISRP